MTSAYAHETVYPHVHPHQTSLVSTDVLLSLLWIQGVVVALYLGARWFRTRNKNQTDGTPLSP
jgi:hypothetical protein